MSAWGTRPASSSRPLPSLDLILQGSEWLARGRAADALHCAEEALRRDPRDADALFLLGAAHYRDGDLAAAEARLKQAIQANGKVAIFHSTLGNLYQDRGALPEAVAAYRRAIRLKPDFAEAHNDLGTAFFAQATPRAPHRAISAPSSCGPIMQSPTPTSARSIASSACRARRAAPCSASCCSGCAACSDGAGVSARWPLSPRSSCASATRGLPCASAAGRSSRTRATRAWWRFSPRHCARTGRWRSHRLREARGRARSADVRSREQLGSLLLETGSPQSALPHLEEWVRLQPRLPRALLALAEAHMVLGNREQASQLAQRSSALGPRDAALWVRLGELLSKQGLAAQAELAFRQAIELDPAAPAAWIRLAGLLRLGGRLQEAKACAEQAVALDDESSAALIALGLALREQGRTSAAVARFEQALRLEPQRAQALQQIGEILRYENKIEEAERRFRDGLKSRPDNIALLVDLAMVLGDQMRYEEAFACIDKALARDANSALALATKGILLDLTGREAQAEALFAAALQVAPDDADIGYNLAICRLRHARFAEGWKGFELRRRKENFIGRYRKFPFAEWQGEPLDGKSILVYPEQDLAMRSCTAPASRSWSLARGTWRSNAITSWSAFCALVSPLRPHGAAAHDGERLGQSPGAAARLPGADGLAAGPLPPPRGGLSPAGRLPGAGRAKSGGVETPPGRPRARPQARAFMAGRRRPYGQGAALADAGAAAAAAAP